jgi:hypothetical protein
MFQPFLMQLAPKSTQTFEITRFVQELSERIRAKGKCLKILLENKCLLIILFAVIAVVHWSTKNSSSESFRPVIAVLTMATPEFTSECLSSWTGLFDICKFLWHQSHFEVGSGLIKINAKPIPSISFHLSQSTIN